MLKVICKAEYIWSRILMMSGISGHEKRAKPLGSPETRGFILVAFAHVNTAKPLRKTANQLFNYCSKK